MKVRTDRIRFRCVGFVDRRSQQLRDDADKLLELEWRRRVAANPKEQARLAREKRPASATVSLLLKRQAG